MDQQHGPAMVTHLNEFFESPNAIRGFLAGVPRWEHFQNGVCVVQPLLTIEENLLNGIPVTKKMVMDSLRLLLLLSSIFASLVAEFLSTIIECEGMDDEDAELVQQFRELVFEHENHVFITMETKKEAVKIMFSMIEDDHHLWCYLEFIIRIFDIEL
jgi:hypothetical protein